MADTADLTLDTPDGPMGVAVARPAGDGQPRGGVVVVQEAFGLTDHIRRVTQRVADAGWLAIAPALFHRQGSPVFAYDDYESMFPVFKELGAAGIETDIDTAFEWLADQGIEPDRTAIVGFCMGGTVSLATAARRPLGAAVTFYGGGVAQGRFGFPPLVELAPSLQSPWLGLYGDLDTGIPVEEVEQLRAAAATATVPTEVVRYPEAEHGFNCDDRPNNHHPASAADAWARTLSWFDRFVV